MRARPSVYEELRNQGVSRRGFLKFCGYMSSVLALPAGSTEAIAQALASKPRPSVIWLSVQECTGCSESLLRSFEPTLESLILDSISLDYHHVLQAAAAKPLNRRPVTGPSSRCRVAKRCPEGTIRKRYPHHRRQGRHQLLQDRHRSAVLRLRP